MDWIYFFSLDIFFFLVVSCALYTGSNVERTLWIKIIIIEYILCASRQSLVWSIKGKANRVVFLSYEFSYNFAFKFVICDLNQLSPFRSHFLFSFFRVFNQIKNRRKNEYYKQFVRLVNLSQVINIIFSEYFVVFTAYYRLAIELRATKREKINVYPTYFIFEFKFLAFLALFPAKSEKMYKIIIQIRPNRGTWFMCHPNNKRGENIFMMQSIHFELPLAIQFFSFFAKYVPSIRWIGT